MNLKLDGSEVTLIDPKNMELNFLILNQRESIISYLEKI